MAEKQNDETRAALCRTPARRTVGTFPILTWRAGGARPALRNHNFDHLAARGQAPKRKTLQRGSAMATDLPPAHGRQPLPQGTLGVALVAMDGLRLPACGLWGWARHTEAAMFVNRAPRFESWQGYQRYV